MCIVVPGTVIAQEVPALLKPAIEQRQVARRLPYGVSDHGDSRPHVVLHKIIAPVNVYAPAVIKSPHQPGFPVIPQELDTVECDLSASYLFCKVSRRLVA